MSRKAFVNESDLEDIANAIRSRNGSNDTYLPSEMGSAISSLMANDDVVLRNEH